MNNKSLLVCLIGIVVLFYSCNLSKGKDKLQESSNTINVDYKNALEILNIDDMIDSVSYIPLERTSPYVGNLKKTLFHNDTIIIWDGKGKAIWTFNSRGKLIARIAKLGKGPGEYLGINDVSVDSNGVINIVNSMGTILKYNIDGTFINQHKYMNNIGNYIDNESYQYLYFYSFSKYNKSSCYLSVFKGNNQVNGFFNATHPWFYDNGNRILSSVSDKIYYFKNFDHHIYELSGKELIPIYSIIFGDNDFVQLNNKIQGAESHEAFNEILQSSFYVGKIDYLTISERHIIFCFYVGKGYSNYGLGCIYNRQTQKTICYKSLKSEEYNITPWITAITDGNYHYVIQETYNMDKALQSKISEEFQMNFNEESNPILIKFKYK